MPAPRLHGGELAYDALRLGFFPWQRERRLAKERERVNIARFSSRVLAAGTFHSLALRREGGIACWGRNDEDQAPPDGIDGDFVAVAAGVKHSLALRGDGRFASWGRNNHGQAPPDGVDGDLLRKLQLSWKKTTKKTGGYRVGILQAREGPFQFREIPEVPLPPLFCVHHRRPPHFQKTVKFSDTFWDAPWTLQPYTHTSCLG